jgi:hypothetical protein
MQLIKNLIKKKRYIAFVGDSFCSSLSHAHWKYNGSSTNVGQGTLGNASFPSLVADHYDLNLLAHGYGGKSWWYSRIKFLKQIKENPKILNKLDAIVFCHTNHHRINSDNQYASSGNHPGGRLEQDCVNSYDWKTSQAQTQWVKYLYDEDFQKWAKLNWFREISREWADIKQVHFHCFEQQDMSDQNNHLLIGQRFTTPLVHVSVAELSGTSREIRNQLIIDRRPNHLSDDNNRVLAEITIEAIDNYKHNVQPLDMSRFKNLINPNYVNFPNGNFGTN